MSEKKPKNTDTKKNKAPADSKKTNTKSNTKKKAATQNRNPDGTFAKGNSFAEKYEEQYADKLIEFFSQPLSRIEYKRTYDENGNIKSEKPVEIVNDFPTIGMFARSIGVSVSAIKSWAGITEDGKFKHDRFAAAYAKVKEWAGGMLESGSISGKLDSSMAKFVLTNDYGKQDKQVIDATVNGLSEKDLALIERVAARLGGQSLEDEEE